MSDQIEITNTNYEQTLTIATEALLGFPKIYDCSVCGSRVSVFPIMPKNDFSKERFAVNGHCLTCFEKNFPKTMEFVR